MSGSSTTRREDQLSKILPSQSETICYAWRKSSIGTSALPKRLITNSHPSGGPEPGAMLRLLRVSRRVSRDRVSVRVSLDERSYHKMRLVRHSLPILDGRDLRERAMHIHPDRPRLGSLFCSLGRGIGRAEATETASRSQRSRVSRGGGQVLTRARSSTCRAARRRS